MGLSWKSSNYIYWRLNNNFVCYWEFRFSLQMDLSSRIMLIDITRERRLFPSSVCDHYTIRFYIYDQFMTKTMYSVVLIVDLGRTFSSLLSNISQTYQQEGMHLRVTSGKRPLYGRGQSSNTQLLIVESTQLMSYTLTLYACV